MTSLDATAPPGKSARRSGGAADEKMANQSEILPGPGSGGLVSPPAVPVPSTSRRHGRTALRNVTVLLVLRVLIVIGGVASAALVPRTMGPATYGRYDLITMLTFLFSMLGALGMGQVINRQAPQLEAEGATDGLRALFGNLLVLRTLATVAVALLYFTITGLWLGDVDRTVLVLLAAAVLLRGPAGLCYSLFLGQGRIGRWALPEMIRQWGSVAFALPGFLLGGLRGAVAGYLISESVIFTVGFVGARRTIARPALRFDLRAVSPLLRIGLAFFASDLLLSAIDRSGAVLLRVVTHDYAQVGMFGVSHQIFGAALLSSSQISNSFLPLLTVLRMRGRAAELRLWVERVVKWLAVAAVLALLGSVTVGKEVVPLVLGRAYAPAYRNLVVLAATLLFLPLNQICCVLALTHDRPARVFHAAVIRLLVFWLAGVALVARGGSFGACIAVGVGVAAQTGYLVARSWRVVGPACRRWCGVTGLGLLFLPAALLRVSPFVNFALFAVTAAAYLLLLRVLGAISTRELRALYRALGIARAAYGKATGAKP
jgi:O-antigen/teichoic acid export membrane protein